MPDEKEKPFIDALTENVVNTRFEDIEQETIDNTKMRILRTIGDAIGGSKGPGSAELVELARDWGGKNEATILGGGIKGRTDDAAMINCVFSRTFDLGLVGYYIDGKHVVSHTSETTVLTAVAVGESKGITGKELMTSLIVGDDLVGRVLNAIDRANPGSPPTPEQARALAKGSPIPPVTFGATVIAGRVLGLNTAQMKNALGIAVHMLPSGGSGGGGEVSVNKNGDSTTKQWQGVKDPWLVAQWAKGPWQRNSLDKLESGMMARNGIQAAQLAKAGCIGVKDALFGERGGYYQGISSINHPERVTKDLGKKYYVEKGFKLYPGGRPTHAPTEAALILGNKHNINVDDIEEVVLNLSPSATAARYTSHPFTVGDYPTGDALYNFYYQVSSALVRRNVNNENFTEKYIRDNKVQNLINKVRLEHLDKPEGIQLDVKMKDGRVFSEYVSQATGTPFNPASKDRLIAKFMEQVEFSETVSKEDAKKMVMLVEKLEELNDMRELMKFAAGRLN